MASFTGALTDVQAPAMPTSNAGASLMPSSSQATAGGGDAVGLFSGLLGVGIKGAEGAMKLGDEFAFKDFTRETSKIMEAQQQGALSGPEAQAQLATHYRAFAQANPAMAPKASELMMAMTGENSAAKLYQESLVEKGQILELFKKDMAYSFEFGLVPPKDPSGNIDREALRTKVQAHIQAEKQLVKDKAAFEKGAKTLEAEAPKYVVSNFSLNQKDVIDDLNSRVEKAGTPEEKAAILAKFPAEISLMKGRLNEAMQKKFATDNPEHYNDTVRKNINETVDMLFKPFEEFVKTGITEAGAKTLKLIADNTMLDQLQKGNILAAVAASGLSPEGQAQVIAHTLTTNPKEVEKGIRGYTSAFGQGKPMGPMAEGDQAIRALNGEPFNKEAAPETVRGSLKLLTQIRKGIAGDPNATPEQIIKHANAMRFAVEVAGGVKGATQLDEFTKEFADPATVATIGKLQEGKPKQDLLTGGMRNVRRSVIANLNEAHNESFRGQLDAAEGKFIMAPRETAEGVPSADETERAFEPGNVGAVRSSQDAETSLRSIEAANRGLDAFVTYAQMSSDPELKKMTRQQLAINFARAASKTADTEVEILNAPEGLANNEFRLTPVPSSSDGELTQGTSATGGGTTGPAPSTGVKGQVPDYDRFIPEKVTETGTNLGKLVRAVIPAESAGDKTAVSKKDARGLMQIQPKTAKWIADKAGIQFDESKIFDAETNIKLGTAYLEYLDKKYGGDLEKVLAAYNWGPPTLDEHIKKRGKVWRRTLPPETKAYLDKVLDVYDA